ncbi:MAG: DUF3857 domain-containing protein [Lentisphaerae bacterium]|nr:DUF3857 domain-containing protein [Lentisphaerota bacterium]
MNYKKILGVFLPALLLCSCVKWSENPPVPPEKVTSNAEQKSIPAAVQSDPAARWRNLDLKKYPNANILNLDSIERISFNSDATYTSNCEEWILLINEKGRKDYQTYHLFFNEFYNKVPEFSCEIIKPDGRVVKPKLQKNITSDQDQMKSNIYDPSNKYLNVGIPDLEVGDILHITSCNKYIRPRMKDIWCDISLLQESEPILHRVCEISAPEKSPLRSIVVKDEVKGTLQQSQSRRNGRIIYRFEVKDVPQLMAERYMPPPYLHSMRVLSSTAPDWETISRWYYNLCEPRLQAVSPELTAHARKLVKNQSGLAAVRKVFDFVAKEIRYTGVTNEDTAPGYEPHDVKDTFAQRHGVCRDKAALLTAMLREAGFDAFMVLFMAGDPKDPEVPNNYFNHAITGVKMPDGKLILMDSTDENTFDLLPAYAMDKSFLCATAQGDTLRRTPVIPPEKNMLVIRTVGDIDSQYQLKLKSELTFRGFNDNIYRDAFARWNPEYRRQFVTSVLKSILPGAELLKMQLQPENVRDLSRELKLIIECKVADYVDIAWGAGCLRMPFFNNGFGALIFMLDDRLLKTRRYPLLLESTAGVDEICSITLPPELEVLALPEYKNVDNKFLQIKNSVVTQKNQLQCKRYITLKKVLVPAAEYPQFRRSVLDLRLADNNRVVVKRCFAGSDVKFPEADSILESSHSQVTVKNAQECLVDTQRKIKVLTYGGVKKYSEITIPFYPGISDAEFVEGWVTAPDGQKVKVDLNTIQIMDSGNSEAAPRYPVGKKIIVPMPGVKIGSTIECRWRVHYRGNPLEVMKTFYEKMPVRQSSIVFDCPQDLSRKLQMVLPEAGFDIVRMNKDDRLIVKVNGRDLPMMPDEPGTPPAEIFAPVAGISFFDPATCSEQLRNALLKAAANAPLSQLLAQKLCGKIPDMAGKIKAIRDYVAKNIRLAGPEMNVLGIRYITPADVTLQENYGNSLDRAVLLYAMLKAVGVKDIKILLASKVPNIPELKDFFCRLPQNVFNTVLLMCKVGERELFLNDSSEYAPLEYSSHNMCMALNSANGELVTVCNEQGFNSGSRDEWVIRMLPGGSAEFCRTVSYYGGKFAGFNEFFANITPEDERKFWEQQFSGVLAGAEMLDKSRDFKLYPGQLVMKFIVPEFWKKSGDYVSFVLPDAGVASLVRTAGKRTLPYWFFPQNQLEVKYSVELPDNWQQCELDGAQFKFELPGNYGKVEQKVKMSAGVLQLEFTADLASAVYVPVQAYGELEALQKKLADPASRTFLFKSTGK